MRTMILLLASLSRAAWAEEPGTPPPTTTVTNASSGSMAPLQATSPPVPLPVTVPPALAVGTVCKQAALGTAKEYERILDGMRAAGATHFLVVGDGLLCGWP